MLQGAHLHVEYPRIAQQARIKQAFVPQRVHPEDLDECSWKPRMARGRQWRDALIVWWIMKAVYVRARIKL